MLKSFIFSLLISLSAAQQFCETSQATCAVHSDPWVFDFGSKLFAFDEEATTYIVNTVEMQVKAVFAKHYDPKQLKDVYVIDQVVYTCGTESETFNSDKVPHKVLTCKVGSCAKNLCDVVVQQGQDPLPNVDLSIRYFGNQGLGGLCYRDTPGCPKDQPVETTVAVQPTTKIVTTAATSIVTTTKAEGATTTSAAKTSVLANVTSPKTLVSTLVTSLQPSSAVVSATASSSSTVTTVAVVSGSGITTTSVSPSTTAVPQIALTTEVVASSKANVQPATTASIKTGILYSGATALTFKSAVSVLTICLFF